ncbi:UNVERIFIED_CONTAM: hypothetical protein K2H54_002199 [Gekko kuhli]
MKLSVVGFGQVNSDIESEEPPLYTPDLSKQTESSVDSDDYGSEASDSDPDGSCKESTRRLSEIPFDCGGGSEEGDNKPYGCDRADVGNSIGVGVDGAFSDVLVSEVPQTNPTSFWHLLGLTFVIERHSRDSRFPGRLTWFVGLMRRKGNSSRLS